VSLQDFLCLNHLNITGRRKHKSLNDVYIYRSKNNTNYKIFYLHVQVTSSYLHVKKVIQSKQCLHLRVKRPHKVPIYRSKGHTKFIFTCQQVKFQITKSTCHTKFPFIGQKVIQNSHLWINRSMFKFTGHTKFRFTGDSIYI